METEQYLGHNTSINRCEGIEKCYNASSPWHVKKKLQLRTSAKDGGHFQEACFKETLEQHSCSESCDGVYRSFTGCCNNLVNTEYGQIIKFESSNVLEFYIIKGRTNSALLRFLPAAYESGTLPRGGLVDSSLPSARTIR